MASSELACDKLEHMRDFGRYVEQLRRITQFKSEKLSECEFEICNAVYGTGNPDISGIGVAVGYVVELALGVLFPLTIVFIRRKKKSSPRLKKLYGILMSGLSVFFDSAAYFALSLQLATIVVLLQKDYGITAADLGAIEARIAQIVAVVSIMPLLYPAALLEPAAGNTRSGVSHNSRLLLLSVTIALSFYPFLSRCLHAFGTSPIGDGEDAEVGRKDWGKVEDMCFPGGFDKLTASTTWKAHESLELIVSLITYLFAAWLLAGLPSTRLAYNGEEVEEKEAKTLSWRRRANKWLKSKPLVSTLPLLVMIGLVVPLLWLIFELRELQGELCRHLKQDYEGGKWGFGQIVSIVLFVPVGVDMAYEWRFEKLLKTA